MGNMQSRETLFTLTALTEIVEASHYKTQVSEATIYLSAKVRVIVHGREFCGTIISAADYADRLATTVASDDSSGIFASVFEDAREQAINRCARNEEFSEATREKRQRGERITYLDSPPPQPPRLLHLAIEREEEPYTLWSISMDSIDAWSLESTTTLIIPSE